MVDRFRYSSDDEEENKDSNDSELFRTAHNQVKQNDFDLLKASTATEI